MSRKQLEQLIISHQKEDNLFIGFGNPEAKILIIGKECTLEYNNLNQVTNVDNIKRWIEYLNGNKNSISKKWRDVEKEEWEKYFNPAKPFWGQLKKININKRKNIKVKDNGGTSRTWYWYQRIMDAVRNKTFRNTDELDFYNDCFITELSAISKNNSREGNREETIKSINERRYLFAEPFFQSFPIIIAACGNSYLSECEMRSIFPNSKVIQSRQLSMNVSLENIEQIVTKVKEAMKENNITL